MVWKNNLNCIGVRNSKNKIIASVNILPLKSDVFKDIYENKMNEADVTYEQIEVYENISPIFYIYHLYLLMKIIEIIIKS